MSPLAEPLLSWYESHRRDLPWRRSRDPYGIWVSEIMLQQTQVATVIPYYLRWLERFPSVESLASARDEEALSLWQGLGYYRRCRMLLEGARWVVRNGMPQDAAGWLKVPGVGRYTAGAIASIGFGEPSPLVDGNVERVFARLTACGLAGGALNREAWSWAGATIVAERPGDWNQALMELGATVCVPANPECGRCPVSAHCTARALARERELPVREPKRAVKTLRHAVWVPFVDGQFGLRQVPPGQWWEGMWEFPRVDVTTTEALPADDLGDVWPEALGSFRHAVTDHRITVVAALVRPLAEAPSLRWVAVDELEELPISAPQRRVLRLALSHLGLEG